MTRFVALCSGILLLGMFAGCQQDNSKLGTEKEAELKNNMTRSLTPDEIKQISGSGKEGGVEAPDRGKK